MKYLIAAVLLLPGLAQAHAMLESAIPPVGSTVSAAPAELQLTYSEGLEPHFTKVAVTAASGARVDQGALHVAPGDAGQLLVPIAKLAPGIYTVTWHAVSVDTHKTEGSYHFTVAP